MMTKYAQFLNRLMDDDPAAADGGQPAGEPDTPEGGDGGDPPSKPEGGESPSGEDGGDPPADPEGGDEGGNDNDTVDFAKLELPDGVELDQAAVEKFSPLMSDMTQDQAQKFATAFAEFRQADAQDRIEAFSQQTEDWYSASQSDKEFGGDKFDESSKLAVQAVEKFGTPELRQFMDDYGVGNHPELIRFMVKVGRATQEDNPGAGGGGAAAERDRASILYPDSNN